eukprot:1271227-Rhodomonas_salina.1
MSPPGFSPLSECENFSSSFRQCKKTVFPVGISDRKGPLSSWKVQVLNSSFPMNNLAVCSICTYAFPYPGSKEFLPGYPGRNSDPVVPGYGPYPPGTGYPCQELRHEIPSSLFTRTAFLP